MSEQLFYITAITGGVVGLFLAALALVWIFGGKEIRDQIREEW